MKADWRDLYPFPSRFLEIPFSETSTDRVRMHYVERGPGEQTSDESVQVASAAGEPSDAASSHPTVLCVHGNPTWSFTYREVLKRVSDQARVIAVDHLGCGLSDKPQKYHYSLEQHVGNLARFVEQLDLRRITLLVHDWGGAIGMGMALKQPDRVERLVILNTALFPPPYIPWRIAVCRTPWLGEWMMRRLNVFARAALIMTLSRLKRLDWPVAAGLISPYCDWNSRIAIARFVQDIPRRKSHPTWQLLSRIEHDIDLLNRCPTRIVWGMKDWCFRPECLERIGTMLPHAQVTRLDDVGHYVMEEAPDEVIREVRNCLDE